MLPRLVEFEDLVGNDFPAVLHVRASLQRYFWRRVRDSNLRRYAASKPRAEIPSEAEGPGL